MVKDAGQARPKAGMVQTGGASYLTLTYRRPKMAPADAQYRVTRSGVLLPWAGGTTVVPVGDPEDRGGYVEVTVRSADPVTAGAQGYLRLEVRR